MHLPLPRLPYADACDRSLLRAEAERPVVLACVDRTLPQHDAALRKLGVQAQQYVDKGTLRPVDLCGREIDPADLRGAYKRIAEACPAGPCAVVVDGLSTLTAASGSLLDALALVRSLAALAARSGSLLVLCAHGDVPGDGALLQSAENLSDWSVEVAALETGRSADVHGQILVRSRCGAEVPEHPGQLSGRWFYRLAEGPGLRFSTQAVL